MSHLCGTAQMADLIDIMVVGAGPAGANAARAAARHGKHVVLLDEQVKPGVCGADRIELSLARQI